MLSQGVNSAGYFAMAIYSMMSRFQFLISLVMLLFAVTQGTAATYYWDANGSTAGVGGSGTWDTTTSLWRLTTDTGTLSTYVSADTSDAYLTGTAGTLTLASDMNFHTLTFGATSGTY